MFISCFLLPKVIKSELTKLLKTHQQRLKNMCINCFPSPELNWTKNKDLGQNQNVFEEFLP